MACKIGSGKKWLVASVVVAVAFALLEFVVHGVVLSNLYMQHAALWRPEAEMQSLCWVTYLGYFVFGLIFTCIYAQGFEPSRSGAGQGLRYGFWIGLLFVGAHTLLCYPYIPWPDSIYAAWFGFGMVEMLLLGLLVGKIYKPAA